MAQPVPLLAILAILLFSVCASAQTPACVARDRDALLAFKAGLSDNGDQLASWTSGGNCCAFKGVTCSAKGEVVNVTFEAFVEDDCEENCIRILSKFRASNTANLIGTTLSKLLSLQVLNLTNFFLQDVTPTGLSALKFLRVLALQRTQLEGPISDDIGKITSLQFLSISQGNGNVNGSIPASLCMLVNLQTLVLSEFPFQSQGRTGAIPACIGQLSQLQTLDLEHNSLSGRIPAAIKALKKLKVFKVTANKINGALPVINPGELPALEVLCLQGNAFTGPIPASFGNLLALRDFRIGGFEDGSLTLVNSKLAGTIPSTLGKLVKLEVLIIRGTSISGIIPPSFADLPVLSDLQLHVNRLTGTIPSSLGKTGALTNFLVNDNQISGGIPASLGGAGKKLATFIAARNQLTGPIPVSLSSLPLNTLDLSFNKLTGSIPPNLGFSISDTLDLSHNQLTGALNPPSLWGLREVILNDNLLTSLGSGSIPDTITANVQTFDVHNNQLAGAVPPWVFQLFNTLALDISNNKLTKLPAIQGTRLGTSYINASSNAITGTIPIAFTQIGGLNSLDLSKNRLTGSIPTGFFGGVATFINYLNFGENQLTGTLPAQLFSGSFTNALIFNKNQLTGSIPARPPNGDFLQYVDFSDNKLSGPIPPSLLAEAPFLQKVRLGNNLLSGPIPDFSSACSNLQSLVLENNQLTGPVLPASLDLSQCDSLVVFDVSGNKLSGGIPASIAGFTTLRVLDLSRNAITGSVPALLSALTAIQILDVSSNKLTGGLPLSQLVSGFTALKVAGSASDFTPGTPLYVDSFFFPATKFFIRDLNMFFSTSSSLNVSRNSLTGPIDPSVGQLKGLNLLDLSRNKFSGAVPASIAQITDLDVFDISFNTLSGRIPSQLKNFPAEDFAGNPGLCGPPLANKC